MRKTITICCLVPLLLLAASCESWLDVQPKTEIKESTMFETEQGFKDALIGCTNCSPSGMPTGPK